MKKILIIGGYGAVGTTITETLSRHFPDKVLVAGRNREKASRLAKKLGNGVIASVFDVNQYDHFQGLEEVSLVIMCVDQSDTRLIRECIQRGIAYLDITANQELTRKIEELDQVARAHQSRVVLSIGLAPGLTNLLAQHALRQQSEEGELSLFVLLGLGEKHGDAAYRWTFDQLHTTYPILTDGRMQMLQSFTKPKKANLSGSRNFYLFNFSDQHALLRTTGLKRVFTRLAFDSRGFTAMVAALRKTGLTRVFSSKRIQQVLIPLFKRLGIGTDLYHIQACLEQKGKRHEYGLKGRGEGKLTAYVAAETALYLLQNPVRTGVSHLHEIIPDIPDFLISIKDHDPSIELEL